MELKENSSTSVPAVSSAAAAGASPNGAARRRRRVKEKRTGGFLPYALILPSVAVIVLVLGVPLYLMGKFSLSRYDLQDIIIGHPHYWGLHNFRELVGSGLFWKATYRNVFFMLACVGFTVVPGLLISLLLTKISAWARLVLTIGLVFVWSMPVLVYTYIFGLMTDRNYGVINYVLMQLGLQDSMNNRWTDNTWLGYGMFVYMIAWVSIPFVAITLYAALSQVPQELVEAATVDGASGWRTFWAITLPVLKPALVIVVTLSVIWDFTIFVQIWAFFNNQLVPEAFQILPIFVYRQAFVLSKYGLGAAASFMFLILMAPIAIFYTRQQLRQRSDFS